MIQYSLYLLINKYNIFISHKGTIRAKRARKEHEKTLWVVSVKKESTKERNTL